MNRITTLVSQELKAYVGGGLTTLMLVIVISLSWVISYFTKVDEGYSVNAIIYPMFLSLIIGSDIMISTFIRERLFGTIEVLILSGIFSANVLLKKDLDLTFNLRSVIIAASGIIGLVCIWIFLQWLRGGADYSVILLSFWDMAISAQLRMTLVVIAFDKT